MKGRVDRAFTHVEGVLALSPELLDRRVPVRRTFTEDGQEQHVEMVADGLGHGANVYLGTLGINRLSSRGAAPLLDGQGGRLATAAE
jgi:hypothetical protein